jgi:anti-sigma regulatory factor (Ser/Thr protein kinase)/predicted transcriptional regulator
MPVEVLAMVIRVRRRGEGVRQFILENVERHSHAMTALTSEKFNISRQAAHRHLKNLVSEGALAQKGHTRNRTYQLTPLLQHQESFTFAPGIDEDFAWAQHVEPIVGKFPENVVSIWQYCFTEMFNNAIDHSGAPGAFLKITKTAANTQIVLMDAGVGIFKKIQTAMNLADERHAILELSKGKLTTDPIKHTGQGLFFTSRLLDSFDILSGNVYFSHVLGTEEDWILERPESQAGTAIFMKLNNHTSKTFKKISDSYSDEDDLGFIKTVVPVKLAQYGNENLISRSQAKRVMARVELFKTVVLNFDGVPTVGQAFTDEIFRVFANTHPTIKIVPINANSEVKRMIASAKLERPVGLPTNLASL